MGSHPVLTGNFVDLVTESLRQFADLSACLGLKSFLVF